MTEQNQISEEERYKYIGFETFGRKTRPFWRDEEERESYVEGIKKQLGSVFRNSVVYSEVMGLSDRIAITIASLVMIVAPFLVWMKVDTLYGTASFSGITGFLNMEGFWFYVEMIGGSVIPLTVYLTTVLAYLSVLFGVLTLVFLFLKARTQENYIRRLKSVLRLQAIPFIIFLAIIVLGLIGQRIPFGSHLGVDGLSASYSIVTFIQFSSIGFWLAIFGLIMNFNKSKEL
ncbi:MAG: hypothetical protein KAT58_03695 [candidate division Zixibacteria bacterium]|nr:hypothetical protein [candidate division Zixibacteria bacterium]